MLRCLCVFALIITFTSFGRAQDENVIRVLSPKATAGAPRIAVEEMFVPAKDPGILLYVRNKHPEDLTSFAPEKTVLFVHGATYPAETSFDLPLDGVSWMDYIAQHGYDVYLMDVRGYGRSTRPPQMDVPADRNAPFADTITAAGDIGAVVDYILARRSLRKIGLLAWSWGTATSATYATAHPDKIARLVLYAPTWIRETPSLIQLPSSGPMGAYRTVNREAAFARWMASGLVRPMVERHAGY
jgi:pimeloyl-ACP methyl ester carboxylesterase